MHERADAGGVKFITVIMLILLSLSVASRH